MTSTIPPTASSDREIIPPECDGYLAEHLFDQAGTVARVLAHLHPTVTADDVVAWRAQYRRYARPGDRGGLTCHTAEREALQRILDEDLTDREMLVRAREATFREFSGMSPVLAMACYDHSGTKIRYWSTEEDARVLSGEDVRGSAVDYQRRLKLLRSLTPPTHRAPDMEPQNAQELITAPETPSPTGTPPEISTEPTTPAESPAPASSEDFATFTVGQGISIAVRRDRRRATLTAGLTRYVLDAAEVQALATLAGAAHQIMEQGEE